MTKFLILLTMILTYLAMPGRALAQSEGSERTRAMVAEGADRFLNGRREEAERILREALVLHDDPLAHYWLARLLASQDSLTSEARTEAIRHYRLAIQLAPDSDDARSAQDRLIDLVGRPKSVRLLALRSEKFKSFDPTATQAVLDKMSRDAGRGNRPPAQKMNWTGAVPAAERLSKESLRKACEGPGSDLEAGYAILVGVETMVAGGKSKLEVTTWVYDAVSDLLYPSARISDREILLFDLLVDYKPDDLVATVANAAWNHHRQVQGDTERSRSTLETLFPLGGSHSAIFGRSQLAYEQARTQPVVALFPILHAKDASTDAGQAAKLKRLERSLSDYWVGRKLSVVGAAGVRRLIEAAQLPDAPFTTPTEAIRAIPNLRYIVIADDFTEKQVHEDLILGGRARVVLSLRLRVLDLTSGTIALDRQLSARRQGQKIGGGSRNELQAIIVQKSREAHLDLLKAIETALAPLKS